MFLFALPVERCIHEYDHRTAGGFERDHAALVAAAKSGRARKICDRPRAESVLAFAFPLRGRTITIAPEEKDE